MWGRVMKLNTLSLEKHTINVNVNGNITTNLFKLFLFFRFLRVLKQLPGMFNVEFYKCLFFNIAKM